MEEQARFDDICKMLRTMEQHIINLIIPIQDIPRVLRGDIKVAEIGRLMQKPIEVNTVDLRNILDTFHRNMVRFEEQVKMLDLARTMNELKYVGMRLHNLEQMVAGMMKNGIKSQVSVDIKLDGNDMVREEWKPEIPLVPIKKSPFEEVDANLSKKLGLKPRKLKKRNGGR